MGTTLYTSRKVIIGKESFSSFCECNFTYSWIRVEQNQTVLEIVWNSKRSKYVNPLYPETLSHMSRVFRSQVTYCSQLWIIIQRQKSIENFVTIYGHERRHKTDNDPNICAVLDRYLSEDTFEDKVPAHVR